MTVGIIRGTSNQINTIHMGDVGSKNLGSLRVENQRFKEHVSAKIDKYFDALRTLYKIRINISTRSLLCNTSSIVPPELLRCSLWTMSVLKVQNVIFKRCILCYIQKVYTQECEG